MATIRQKVIAQSPFLKHLLPSNRHQLLHPLQLLPQLKHQLLHPLQLLPQPKHQLLHPLQLLPQPKHQLLHPLQLLLSKHTLPAPAASEQQTVGIYRSGVWKLDSNGDTDFTGDDTTFFFGTRGDTPVTGDWNGDGITDAGVFQSYSGNWILETAKTGAVYKKFQFGTLR